MFYRVALYSHLAAPFVIYCRYGHSLFVASHGFTSYLALHHESVFIIACDSLWLFFQCSELFALFLKLIYNTLKVYFVFMPLLNSTYISLHISYGARISK